MSAPFRIRENGIDLFVRLTPKSSMDRLEGVETAADGRSHLKARVRAVPENGAANHALERLVAKDAGRAGIGRFGCRWRHEPAEDCAHRGRSRGAGAAR